MHVRLGLSLRQIRKIEKEVVQIMETATKRDISRDVLKNLLNHIERWEKNIISRSLEINQLIRNVPEAEKIVFALYLSADLSSLLSAYLCAIDARVQAIEQKHTQKRSI